MAALNPGALNRRITIQTQATAQDALGQPAQTWSAAYTCWASIDIQNSQLIYSTAEFMAKVAYRLTVRWTSSFIFQPNQRIVYSEPTTGVVHTYEIQAVLNTKAANQEVVLMSYELDGQE